LRFKYAGQRFGCGVCLLTWSQADENLVHSNPEVSMGENLGKTGRVLWKAVIFFSVLVAGLSIAGYPPSARGIVAFVIASLLFGLGVEHAVVRQENSKT
jgi:hypothetical protein